MEIEERKLSDMRPYDRNARQNDAAVDAVARSIRQFGFRQPIVVDEDGVIVAGHTRYKAAEALGLETVPVHVARGLSPEQIRAYRLADNRTGELSEWDLDLLPLELADLQEAEIELETIGFTDEELAELMPDEHTPDFAPAEPAENTLLDRKAGGKPTTQTCPRCGHEFQA